jgi:hypothetical protein
LQGFCGKIIVYLIGGRSSCSVIQVVTNLPEGQVPGRPDPAFNVEYEKDKVKVAWLRKDLSTLPVTLPATCSTITTDSKISW